MSNKNISTEEFADYNRFAPDTVLEARKILAIDRIAEALNHIAVELARNGMKNVSEIIEGQWREVE